MFPVECIVRGYLAGSGLKEYQKQGTVCGIQLPEGLVNSSKLPEPIFTPSTKPRSATTMRTSASSAARRSSARMPPRSCATWPSRCTPLPATTPPRTASSLPTPSSSSVSSTARSSWPTRCSRPTPRFWPGDAYEPGRDQASFDKQYVRDWLNANWDRQATRRICPGGHRAHQPEVHRGVREDLRQEVRVLAPGPAGPHKQYRFARTHAASRIGPRQAAPASSRSRARGDAGAPHATAAEEGSPADRRAKE